MKTIVADGIWDFGFSEEIKLNGSMPDIKFETALSVPGCFDVAQPFFGKRGTGCYRRTVRTGGNIRLFIDGLGVEGEVYWDGELIGKCPYAYMPEKFNFNAGEYKDHELVIAVSNCFNKV